jgi:hypothetical protein
VAGWRVCAGVPGVKPVLVELTDFKTKEKVDELEVDAVLVATGRAPYTQARAGPPLVLFFFPAKGLSRMWRWASALRGCLLSRVLHRPTAALAQAMLALPSRSRPSSTCVKTAPARPRSDPQVKRRVLWAACGQGPT